LALDVFLSIWQGQNGYGRGFRFVVGFFFGVLGLTACPGLPLEYDARAAMNV
jgi:hypothetical protein